MNTASKRSSAIRMGRPWGLALPVPDGTVAQADRQHVAWSYSGILAAAAAVADFKELLAVWEQGAVPLAVWEQGAVPYAVTE